MAEGEKVTAAVREFVKQEDQKIINQLNAFRDSFNEQSHENQMAMKDVASSNGKLSRSIDRMTEQTEKRERYVDQILNEHDKKIKGQAVEVSQLKDSRKDRHERNKHLYNLLGN
ncbi:hypothetical protein [Alkalicoccobacillus gibsonii]|uniref:hypothetical protein n=1 Tax=Alkalicoccobacillus gibsonii TaxID=79881 RepID=UPI0035150C9D